MLRLGRLTDYGTVIMTHLARNPGRICCAAEIAAATGVAPPTASKILKALARHHLLQSSRGANGGYLLARPPEQISIAQVIDALEGPTGMTECSVAAGLCAQEGLCAIRANWQSINREIFRVLGGVTLADMAQPLLQPVDTGALHARRAVGPQAGVL